MTTESSHHEENSLDHEKGSAPESGSGCGTDCACGEPAPKSNSTLKIALCLIVAVAICGFLVFKLANTGPQKTAQCPETNGSSASPAQENKGPVTNSSSQQGGSGAPIAAISELNRVAKTLNTVFVIVPTKDNAPLNKESATVLASFEKTLNAKGLSTGIFTLQSSSSEYPAAIVKVPPPGIIVLTKEGGIGYVSGEISEKKLIQAQVASIRGEGDGGSGGCPNPAGNKSAAPGK